MTDTEIRPSLRCARAMHNLSLCTRQPENFLAEFIAMYTGCDELLATLDGLVAEVKAGRWTD